MLRKTIVALAATAFTEVVPMSMPTVTSGDRAVIVCQYGGP